MACNPPYCISGNSGGGVCACCKCCPPENCYTSWTYTYLCGTTASDWNGEESSGCDCSSLPSLSLLPKLNVAFPEFQYNTTDPFVFALQTTSAACSIPCSTITITVSTDGCCLYGNGYSFKAIGGGTISLSGCGEACEGSFYCSINGSGSSVTVGDCEDVSVLITPPLRDCCSCCLISSEGAPLNSSFYAKTRIQKTTGKRKVVINKQALISRVLKNFRV